MKLEQLSVKLAKLEFSHVTYDNGLPPAVVCTAYDADGNQIHRCAAEYKDDQNMGISRNLDTIAGVLREAYKEADGSPSFTWHK